MTRPRGLLVDIDGVLTVSWEALPGTAEAFAAVRAAGIPVRLVTNTTSRTRAQITAALRDAGLAVAEADVLAAPAVLAAHLATEHPGARCLLLSSGDLAGGLAGVDLVGPTAAPGDVDVVVLGGAGGEFTYEALNRAARCLLAGAALVAVHRSLLWRTADGLQLDTGAYLPGLELATGVRATVVGKPGAVMFLTGVRELGLAPEDVAMVGDDLDTDVRAAQRLGLVGVQVRTGKFREAQLAEGEAPDVLLDSFAQVPQWLGI